MTDTNWSEWINWAATGYSVCPLEDGTLNQVRFIHSVADENTFPECWEWNDLGRGSITAYRYELPKETDIWADAPRDAKYYDPVARVYYDVRDGCRWFWAPGATVWSLTSMSEDRLEGPDLIKRPALAPPMQADLEHLARTVPEWNESLDRLCNHKIGIEWFSSENFPDRHGYSEGEWLQARRDLGLVTTEGEDEAFDAMAKRDVFEEIVEGFDDLRAGNFNSFWVKDPSALSDRPYSKYFRDVSRLDSIDVYRVHKLFTLEDHALCHASKKILLGGDRTGGKSLEEDIREARDTLNRWLEMEREL